MSLEPISGDIPGAQVFGGWVQPGTWEVISLSASAQDVAAFAGFDESPLSSTGELYSTGGGEDWKNERHF